MRDRFTRFGCFVALTAISWPLWLDAQGAQKSSLDGVYTETQAQRGRKIYGEQCVECHGHDLEGKYESAALGDDQFRSNWEDRTLLELFDRIKNTMSGDEAGMISTGPPPPLTRQQTADLVAFLLWFNGAPAGKNELSTGAEVLREIRFRSPKP